MREIFYDLDAYNKQDLETQDYYNDSRYSGVRALDDGDIVSFA